jgi:GNAT superfamily N-acetyltransferase/L-amino acid N-acyltransferase YncA
METSPMSVEQTASIYPLKDGSRLHVRVLEPPLGELTDRIEYWWRDVRAPLLAGELAGTSIDRFVIGEVDGVYAGSMMYCMPRDTRDLALLEMVWTHPEYRRRGIARILLRHALADFRSMGGLAISLCTTNPVAYAMYRQEGFLPLLGDGMRYVAPPHDPRTFDRDYFADAGPARIRRGTWGDIARVSTLYNLPEPDWLIKDYPRRVFRDMRYESHYIRVWKPASEGHGLVLVLENPLRRVVGIVSVVEVDSFYEQHVSTIDVWCCPAYRGQMPDLLAAAVRQANKQVAEIVQATIAEGDLEKQQLFQAAGFTESARLSGRLRVGDQRHDLLIYELRLSLKDHPIHLLADYYGARQSFRTVTDQESSG